MPVFLLKSSDVDTFKDVLGAQGEKHDLVIDLKHVNEFDLSKNVIEIFMNPLPNKNPLIPFLKDFK